MHETIVNLKIFLKNKGISLQAIIVKHFSRKNISFFIKLFSGNF
jgi:hypothetical protein